jgi:hypothetical protein
MDAGEIISGSLVCRVLGLANATRIPMPSDLRDQLQQMLGTTFTVDRELGGGGMSHVFIATADVWVREIRT